MHTDWIHLPRDERHPQPLVHSQGRHLNHLHLPPEHTLLDPTCPSSRHRCAVYEPGIQISFSVNPSKTTALGAISAVGFLCIHGITSLAIDGNSDHAALLGAKGLYGVSGSAQDRRRLVDGEAIASSQVRLRQDV